MYAPVHLTFVLYVWCVMMALSEIALCPDVQVMRRQERYAYHLLFFFKFKLSKLELQMEIIQERIYYAGGGGLAPAFASRGDFLFSFCFPAKNS